MSGSPIYSFEGYEGEKKALAELCERWGFWSFPETLYTLEQRNSQLWYMFQQRTHWFAALFVYFSPPTSDVLFLYVQPEHRGKGHALLLLEKFWDELRSRGDIETLLLEVRPSNHAAIALYEKFGMKALHRRPKYYSDGDDALIYERKVESG